MSVKCFAYRLLTLVKFCSDIEEIPTLQYFKSQTFKILVLDIYIMFLLCCFTSYKSFFRAGREKSSIGCRKH